MKFVTAVYQREELPGVLNAQETGVYWLREILKLRPPATLLEFIQREEPEIDAIRSYISDPNNTPVPLDRIKLLAPIPQPLRNIICLGMNYMDHIKELKGPDGKPRPVPDVPVYFGKMADRIIGPGEPILLHKHATEAVDYEVELAAVIGKSGRDIPKEQAHRHIFGYSIMNDITARDLQQQHQQFIRGKSLDTFTAMGPAILYHDGVQVPVELNLECLVNEEVRQSSNTRNFIFDLPHIISDLSKGTTLKAGDIIATGTPAGVGKGFEPPKYLTEGDRVLCKIEKIGSLFNIVEGE